MSEQKSKLQQIREILFSTEAEVKEVVTDEVKLMEMKLDDGVTIIEADPDFEVGATVNVKTEDGQLIPVPVNGEGTPYVLEDGRTFTVVEEGVIAEVMEAGQEEEVEEPMEEEVAAADKPNETPLPKSIIESMVKETKFSKEEVEAKDTKIAELEAKIAELSKVVEEEEVVELETAKIVHNPESGEESKGIRFQFGASRVPTIADNVMNRIANIKK
jgi:hypothetical protein